LADAMVVDPDSGEFLLDDEHRLVSLMLGS